MRLWSISPKYLDAKGLGGLWRESLLAQKVLAGATRGWKNHPQLLRFKNHPNPLSAIGFYLFKIYEEAKNRGYNYNISKINKQVNKTRLITVTDGQLNYEFKMLKERLTKRNLRKLKELLALEKQFLFPEPHPIFRVVEGGVELWETRYWKKATVLQIF